jgi:hypothetical protein
MAGYERHACSRLGRVLAGGALLAATLVMAGCGADAPVGRVDGVAIGREPMQRILEHAREEATNEGKAFPASSTTEYHALQNQALDVVVYREELTLSAGRLGVVVNDDAVEARMKATRREKEQQSDEGDEGGDNERFRADGTRSALLYAAVYDRLSQGVTISKADVARYRALHPTALGDAQAIKHDLFVAATNARMARWVAAMRKSYTSKVEYEAGFGAPTSTGS